MTEQRLELEQKLKDDTMPEEELRGMMDKFCLYGYLNAAA